MDKVSLLQNLFFVLILLGTTTIFATRNQCVNHHGDTGFCTHREICRLLKGVNIGFCNSTLNIVCCMDLPCSKSQMKIKNVVKFRVKKSKGTSRLIVPSCGIRNERDRQIIGGKSITDSLRHPWMVSLWQRNSTTNMFMDSFPICGASIITNRHVLTAAHCIMSSHEDLFILGGTTKNKLPSSFSGTRKVVIGIKKIDIHPHFDILKLENDIAILTLNQPIKFRPDLSPICLPNPGDEELRDYVTVSGWGCESEKCDESEKPKSLKETVLPVIPNKVAMCWFMADSKQKGREEYIPKSLFLVGGDVSGLKSTCRGDSGSPVTRPRASDGRIEVVGLVSWSKGCGRKFRPSVWTNVRNYLTWIYRNLK